jgi:tRNA-2-methylthio-N6-dimethylallyladenosine synthase
LHEVVATQNKLSLQSNLKDIGGLFEILIEGDSKKSDADWMGRSSHGKVFVFPKGEYGFKKGDYVTVRATGCTQGTLLSEIVEGSIA